MFAILVLLALSGGLVSVAALPPEEGSPDCSKFNDSARYNETLQKCVVQYWGGCSPTKTEDYQCGSGEDGFCRDGQCSCDASHSVLLLSVRNESGDPRDFFYDYTCLPRVEYGETCTFTRGLGGISCVNNLSCVNETCACEGEWDADAVVCRNDEWCSTGIAEDGLSFTWIGGTFYEKATRSCKCEPGRPCKELDGGNAGPEKCPLHSEFKPGSSEDSGVPEPGRCECEAGYTSLRLDDELRQRSPALPDTYCVPRGLVGQACTGWSTAGSCSPGMECEGEGDEKVCKCDGDWSEADNFCYGQKSCNWMEPRPVDWYLPWVFYQEGDMHCTCFLGAACPFAAGNHTPRVTCPGNSTIKTSTDTNEKPYCVCDESLTPAAGSKVCVPKPSHGEACQEVAVQGGKRFEPCAGGNWCSYSGKCVCRYGKVWVESRERCTPFAGQTCTAEEGCIPNAECGADNRCACLPGFYSHDHGSICRLEGELGARCSSDDDCKHFTECVQKPGSRDQECSCQGDWNATESLCHGFRRCRAILGTGATYESESANCKCNVGAICELGAVKLENCPPGARPTEAGTGCECEEGHTPLNKGGQCVPARKFGEVCEHPDPHYSGGMAIVPVGQCMNGSWCHDGVCKCHAPTSMWNQVLLSCVLKSGAYCEARDVCTPNTKCENWSCTCPEAEGFRATPSGECFGGHGAACHNNGNCARGFECMDGQCACRSVAGQFYSPESEKCVSRVGAHCDPYSNNTALCPPESTCDITTSKCECKAERVPAQNNARCFKALKYGENCTSNDCDPQKGLACDGEGRCACADLDLVYHEGQGACLAPLGSRCGNCKVPGSCVPMAEEAELGERPECEHYVLVCESGLECHGNDGGDGTGKVCSTRRVGTADGSAPTGNSD